VHRFAAWYLGGNPETSGPYTLLYGNKPKTCALGVTRFVQLSVQDATDPADKWEPRKTWDEFVAKHDLWMRDDKGNKIHGWGKADNGRYVVDLSKSTDWPSIITECEAKARKAGASGIAYDDLSVRCFFSAADGRYGKAAWHRNALRIATASAQPNSISGWKEFYTPMELLWSFTYAKMEGFRFAPDFGGKGWSGPAGAPFTWDTWWHGVRIPELYGIRRLQAAGIIPVIEACVDPGWSNDAQDRYARMAVVTACLADCYVALHEQYQWDEPWLTPWHDDAAKLGDPEGEHIERPSGVWVRNYENGRVLLNPTDHEVKGLRAHDAKIVVM